MWKSVDRDQLRQDLQMVLDKGIRSLAITLMHSYMYVLFTMWHSLYQAVLYRVHSGLSVCLPVCLLHACL